MTSKFEALEPRSWHFLPEARHFVHWIIKINDLNAIKNMAKPFEMHKMHSEYSFCHQKVRKFFTPHLQVFSPPLVFYPPFREHVCHIKSCTEIFVD